MSALPTIFEPIAIGGDHDVDGGMIETLALRIACARSAAAVPLGDVVTKLHNYECTRDMACARNCPTGAIRLHNV